MWTKEIHICYLTFKFKHKLEELRNSSERDCVIKYSEKCQCALYVYTVGIVVSGLLVKV